MNHHESHSHDDLIVLAGLLHDIGKVIHRAGYNKRHELLSADLIREYSEVFNIMGMNVNKLVNLIICHHYLRTREPRCDPSDELLNYLIKADRASAPERLKSKEFGKVLTKRLVSPLWVKYYYEKYGKNYSEDKVKRIVKHSRICYEPIPMTNISRYGKGINIVRDIYKATNCNNENNGNLQNSYEEIYEEIREFLERISDLLSKNVMDKKSFIDTLINYIRYTLLLVPDDIYWTPLPDTSLATHLILTAAIAYATYRARSERIRLGVLDLSGIQAFISSLGKTKGALRQIRGRSILLQLVMRASSRYLLEKLGLSPISLILLRGDNALFIIPDLEEIDTKFDKAIAEINKSLYEIFHGDIYVAGALSEPFKPEYTMPWNPEHCMKGFSKALLEISEKLGKDKYKKLWRISKYITERQRQYLSDQSLPEQCDICRKTIIKSELIYLKNSPIIEKFPYFENLMKDGVEKICPACLLSHLAGSTAVNLEFIVEIEDHDITEQLYNEIIGRSKRQLLIKQPKNYEYTVIPFPGLGRTYILLSLKPGKEINNPIEAWEELRNILIKLIINTLIKKYYTEYLSEKTLVNKDIKVNILRVNDPPSMLPPRKIFIEPIKIRGINLKYGFANIFINFTSKATVELNDLAKVAENSEKYTYLSWIKTDIDHMGLTGLYLSGSIGRYITMAELVNFYTNMLGYRILDYDAYHPGTKSTKISDYAIVVFSGGDDTFVISRYAEGLYYLRHYRSWFRDFFGEIIDRKNGKEDREEPLTLSAGYFISEADYPAYLSYKKVIEKLKTAKNEGRNLVDISFLEIDGSIFEKANYNQQTPPLKSMDWSIFENIIDPSLYKEIIEWVKNNRVLSFKIMITLKQIAEVVYAILLSQKMIKTTQPNIKTLYRRLAENIIAFSYTYTKIKETPRGRTLERIAKSVSNKLKCPPALPKEYIVLLNNNDLKELFKSASIFYRLFQMVQLRIRENL